MWSWRLALQCWWLCFSSTSSSLEAIHQRTSYSLVIGAAMCISQLMTTMHCFGAESSFHVRISRTFRHYSLCEGENMNCFQCDLAWYVESCLDWSGSEWSLTRLWWGMTDSNPYADSGPSLHFHLFNLLAILLRRSPWPWSYLKRLIQNWTTLHSHCSHIIQFSPHSNLTLNT